MLECSFAAFSKCFGPFLLVTLMLLVSDNSQAVEPTIDSTSAEQLKQLNDQTIIGNRISLGFDWDQFKHGAEKATWTPAALWGCRVSDSHDVTDWLTLTFNADYNHSIAETNDVRPQRYFELSLPSTLILPDKWSMGTRYKATVDFQNGGRWGHTVSAGVAKRLSKVPVVLSASLEKPLSNTGKKFQVSITIVYYFQRYHLAK